MTATISHDRRPSATPTTSVPPARGAIAAMVAGAGLTVLALAWLVVDLASTDSLTAHLAEVYAGEVEPPPTSAVAAYLFTVGALGVAGWLVTARAVAQRRRWARPLATGLFVAGVLLAVAHLTVAEYGRTILPLEVGLASAVVCVPGLLAVTHLWARREP